SNTVTLSNNGNTAIAVAKIDGAWTVADETAVTINDWTTSANNYLKIYTTSAARHSGVWDTGGYRLATTTIFSIVEDYARIEGLQIDCNNGANDCVKLASTTSSGTINFDSMIIKNSGTGYAINAASTSNLSEVIIKNLLAYNLGNEGIYGNSSDIDNLKIYNSTIVKNNTNTAVSNTGIRYALAKNVAVFNYGGLDNNKNFLNLHADSANLICNDDSCTAYSNSTQTTQALIGLFTDFENYDYSIRNIYSDLCNTGLVITAVENDIAGVSRPRDSLYDIGAFEYNGPKPKYRIKSGGDGGIKMQGYIEFK
ncbi:hypothetical protein KAI65_06410, partial [Candidatus Parcubacteria bacterium]|nr:hypothetical protein [Candidatus Parcubacteria bacterium]